MSEYNYENEIVESSLTIYEMESAYNTTVKDGGVLIVNEYGTAENTIVEAGGSMTVYGYHYGSLTIEEGATVEFEDFSSLNLSVNALSGANNEPLVNDFSRIIFSGESSPSLSVTVKEDQAPGTYKLAGNAGSLASSYNYSALNLTIENSGSEYYSPTELNSLLISGNKGYSLSLDESDTLTLTVTDVSMYLVSDNDTIKAGETGYVTGSVSGVIVEEGGTIIIPDITGDWGKRDFLEDENGNYSEKFESTQLDITVKAGATLADLRTNDNDGWYWDEETNTNIYIPAITGITLEKGAKVDGFTLLQKLDYPDVSGNNYNPDEKHSLYVSVESGDSVDLSNVYNLRIHPTHVTLKSGGSLTLSHTFTWRHLTIEAGSTFNGFKMDHKVTSVQEDGEIELHLGNLVVYSGDHAQLGSDEHVSTLTVKSGGKIDFLDEDTEVRKLILEKGAIVNGFTVGADSEARTLVFDNLIAEKGTNAWLIENQCAGKMVIKSGANVRFDAMDPIHVFYDPGTLFDLTVEAGSIVNGFNVLTTTTGKRGIQLGELELASGSAILQEYQSAEAITVKSDTSLRLYNKTSVKKLSAEAGACINGFTITEGFTEQTGVNLGNILLDDYSYGHLYEGQTATFSTDFDFSEYSDDYSPQIHLNGFSVNLTENIENMEGVHLKNAEVGTDNAYMGGEEWYEDYEDYVENIAFLYDGQTAENVTVYTHYGMTLHEGAKIRDVTIKAGGGLNNFILKKGGTFGEGELTAEIVIDGNIHGAYVIEENADIFNGQTVRNVQVKDDGAISIWGGTLENITVSGNDGGLEFFGQGAAIKNINMKAGSHVVFDLEASAEWTQDGVLIDDLKQIKGATSYYLDMDNGIENGIWKLAGNAKGFSKTVNVMIGNIENYFILKAGGAAQMFNGQKYALDIDSNGFLNLVVSAFLPYSSATLNPEKETRFELVSTGGGSVALKLSANSSGAEILNYTKDLTGYQTEGSNKVSSLAKPDSLVSEKPQNVIAVQDEKSDIFFTRKHDVWASGFLAQHGGIKSSSIMRSSTGWTGTNEKVLLDGKNKIADVFNACEDRNILYLTDTGNGDALFVDDVFTENPGSGARVAQIDEIRAGAGNDVIDFTSQRYDYDGDGVIFRGGDGHDVIWSNDGENMLFGDEGNDRLVGGTDNDVLVGGAGRDSMLGGGGDDIFCFGGNFGNDTVSQCNGGSITLWFESGSSENWNSETGIYDDGNGNTVSVSSVSSVVSVIFGDNDGTAVNGLTCTQLKDLGAFSEYSTKKVFEEEGTNSVLAVL